jgi:hypothetical protein
MGESIHVRTVPMPARAVPGASGKTEQRPFLVIMPISSRVGFVALEGVSMP